MKQTVVITGSSSGIGLETAKYFHSNGWNVIATMRNPDKRNTDLHSLDIDIQHLDVTDIISIRNVINYAINKYEKIDVIVNNAGYLLKGVFEYARSEDIIAQFKTNVFGVMELTREIIPHFRKNNAGTIINISSIGGKISVPFSEIYNSTKWAIEGFSEGLYYELLKFNIKVKIIEPGVIKSDFYGRSMNEIDLQKDLEYMEIYEKFNNKNNAIIERGSHPKVIAEVIYKVANDKSNRLRYHAGAFSGLLLFLRKFLPDKIFLIFNKI